MANCSQYLARNLKQLPLDTVTNAVAILQHDPLWGPDRLWYDEFLDRIFIANSPTRVWRDEDDTALTVHIQSTTELTKLKEHLVAKAVKLVAFQRTRHIVRDWLNTLTWDGIDRLTTAFEDYWGADPTPSQPQDHVRAASRNFFIGMVARVFQPGCQLDNMVVFEGGQGIFKTSSLRILAGDWYALGRESVMHKDFFQVLSGKLLVEIGELDAFRGAEVSHIKTVISTPTDTYRKSYGHHPVDVPRQCIFVGTTNKDDWAHDETGARRFWPIKCGIIEKDLLRAARDQLFAEAVVAFQAGEHWYDMPASTAQVQSDRYAEDAWSDVVLPWLTTQTDVTTKEVLAGPLKSLAPAMDKSDQMRVAKILVRQGWQRRMTRTVSWSGRPAVTQVWFPPAPTPQVATVATDL